VDFSRAGPRWGPLDFLRGILFPHTMFIAAIAGALVPSESHNKADYTGQYVSWAMFNGVRTA
jgi:hypothetical protein